MRTQSQTPEVIDTVEVPRTRRREAGVIQQRAQGTTRLNRLRRADLEARFPGLLDCVLKAADHANVLEGPEATTLERVVAAAGASESHVVA